MDIRKHTVLNLSVYGILLMLNIIGEVQGTRMLVYATKPLLMLVLGSWFFFNSRRVGDRFTLLIQAGLLFSLFGDVALMFQHVDEFNFLIGLGAFMVAQLCYALAFAQNISETPGGQGLLVGSLLAAAVVGYGIIFASDLLPRMEETLVLPVTIYAIAICTMGVLAALRFGRTYTQSFVLVFAGALLFIVSDSLLATNRFARPLYHASWSVMLTYGLGQALITAGALWHVLNPEEIRRKAALST
jgi:uncharacterized membrane protein YhhN